MKPDGGPAFPADGSQAQAEARWYGMTLRDYFAAKAMHAELNTAGMLTGPAEALIAEAEKCGRTVEAQIAFNSYLVADAMLAERAKP